MFCHCHHIYHHQFRHLCHRRCHLRIRCECPRKSGVHDTDTGAIHCCLHCHCYSGENGVVSGVAVATNVILSIIFCLTSVRELCCWFWCCCQCCRQCCFQFRRPCHRYDTEACAVASVFFIFVPLMQTLALLLESRPKSPPVSSREHRQWCQRPYLLQFHLHCCRHDTDICVVCGVVASDVASVIDGVVASDIASVDTLKLY